MKHIPKPGDLHPCPGLACSCPLEQPELPIDHSEGPYKNLTCVSGRGRTTSRDPDTLTFKVDVKQFILNRTVAEAITVRCHIPGPMDRREALENLPSPMTRVRFSGLLKWEENESWGEINIALIAFSILDD